MSLVAVRALAWFQHGLVAEGQRKIHQSRLRALNHQQQRGVFDQKMTRDGIGLHSRRPRCVQQNVPLRRKHFPDSGPSLTLSCILSWFENFRDWESIKQEVNITTRVTTRSTLRMSIVPFKFAGSKSLMAYILKTVYSCSGQQTLDFL